MRTPQNTPENEYDLGDLTSKEIACLRAWNSFARTENHLTKKSKFNLDHYRKVKEARQCKN